MPILLQKDDGSYQEPRTSSRARLVVLSEVMSPDEISSELKLAPDRWWLRGEFVTYPTEKRWRRSRPHPFNGWEFGSRLPESAPPEAHLLDLVTRIGSSAPLVARLVNNSAIKSVQLRLVHNSDNVNPGMSLDDSLLKQVVALGTGVEFEVYALLDDANMPADWRAAFDRWNEELARRQAQLPDKEASGDKRPGGPRSDETLH